MKYIVSYSKPHSHYVDIEFIVDKIDRDEITLQLPSWRPGRYELGNFAKNVQKFKVFDESDKELSFKKVKKDAWVVNTKGISEIHVKYNYYAEELNAGSTYLDDDQLYMNPVNCCIYVPERILHPIEFVLDIPQNYSVASGMELGDKKNVFKLKDFHDLADSPFIASPSLQRKSFEMKGVEFTLWFQGVCKPEWEKVERDFKLFVKEQLEMMNVFPVKGYHFLFQILPYSAYHGVEHTTSTVVTLGPGYELNSKLYNDFVGVSSHELFHAWNIKTIRPADLFPYDYTTENYSRLGYVCEGVTTYYGDVLLFRSGVYSQEVFVDTFVKTLQKHFDNFGRYNLSVADSSFDTWLDGYTAGVPNRKVSIYTEGSLIAFVTDMFIRENSSNKHSLDDVMRYLNENYALKNVGYTEMDYKSAVEKFAGTSYDTIFNNYISAPADYRPILEHALNYIGYELTFETTEKAHEHAFGIKVQDMSQICKVTSVFPDSVAENSGIAVGDIIVSINNIHISNTTPSKSLAGWCNYFLNEGTKPIEMVVSEKNGVKKIVLQPAPKAYFKSVNIRKLNTASEAQKNNFKSWSKKEY